MTPPIPFRCNVAASLELPPKLENELNGLNRLVRKVVKRVLEDRDWRADILDVLREAQRETLVIFYMLKNCPMPTSGSNAGSPEGSGGSTSTSFIDAYIKGNSWGP